MQLPRWFHWLASALAVLIAAVLIAGILSVPYRALQPPGGNDQPRLHLNTKNSTRFDGQTLAAVAAGVSRAVYPATSAATSPEVVLLYNPNAWQPALRAASLLRPLKGLLLPATDGAAAEIARLAPSGNALAGGAVFLLDGVEPMPGLEAMPLPDAQIEELRFRAGEPPRHALLVSRDDPGTALLAAPWAAYSGDLIVFDAAAAPPDVTLYALGNARADGAVRIGGGDPARTAVAFAQFAAPDDPFFGWGMNADTLTGYRAYTLARADEPATALLSANLAVRGKPGPLLWAEAERLPPVVNDYLWSQRAAFWVTPAEGPFHHFWILGGPEQVAFTAQGQADYAVEIGPYLGKGVGMSGIDLLAAAWVTLGLASAAWIAVHQAKFLSAQLWIMRLAWPLLAMMCGPFGIAMYWLAYDRPLMQMGKMNLWDRPLWLQGLAATASAVGFGASLMIVTGFIATSFGLPLMPSRVPGLFLLGSPMILVMILNYVVAVLVSWLVFQTPMLAMFYQRTYRDTLFLALPLVLASMTAAALAMNPGMWWLMMWHLPMMPSEESIAWFGVMFFTAFLAFVAAWPLNYALVRLHRKSGLM